MVPEIKAFNEDDLIEIYEFFKSLSNRKFYDRI